MRIAYTQIHTYNLATLARPRVQAHICGFRFMIFMHLFILIFSLLGYVCRNVYVRLLGYEIYGTFRARPSMLYGRERIFANRWLPAGSTCWVSLEHKYFLEFTGVQYCGAVW